MASLDGLTFSLSELKEIHFPPGTFGMVGSGSFVYPVMSLVPSKTKSFKGTGVVIGVKNAKENWFTTDCYVYDFPAVERRSLLEEWLEAHPCYYMHFADGVINERIGFIVEKTDVL